MANLKIDLIEMLNEKEDVFKDSLMKMFERTRNDLEQSQNEIDSLEKKNVYENLSFFQIQNLKKNLIEIEKNNCFYLKYLRKHLQDEINQLKSSIKNQEQQQRFVNEVNDKFTRLYQSVLLKEIYNSIGLFNEIDSIISLFTGIGVLGIVPIEMTLIIDNTASVLMFKDKLKELYNKVHLILQSLENKQSQQMNLFQQYFQYLKSNRDL